MNFVRFFKGWFRWFANQPDVDVGDIIELTEQAVDWDETEIYWAVKGTHGIVIEKNGKWRFSVLFASGKTMRLFGRNSVKRVL